MSALVVGREAASRFVVALFGSVPAGTLIEVRFRLTVGMGQRFFSVDTAAPVVDAVLSLASRTDVFVGVLPRVRRRGRLEDVVGQSGVIWADCDTPESARKLGSFQPRPSMVVGSGSGQHRHAYWFLREPIDLASVESLNRRLALALGADAGVVTKPHTILRPPGSVNRKHSPPAPVHLIDLDFGRRVSRGELDRNLPADRAPVSQPIRSTSRRRHIDRSAEPWLELEPADYYRAITGHEPRRDGRVRCPSAGHEDRRPSAQLYRGPGTGWYCFSCGAGGGAVDLVAALRGWPTGRELRGEQFRECVAELRGIFNLGEVPRGGCVR